MDEQKFLLIDYKPRQSKEERDAEITHLFMEEHWTTYEIGQIYGLTHQRVSQILRQAIILTRLDKEWEKTKRLNMLWRFASKKTESQKDPVDILDQMRVEMKDETPSIIIKQENFTDDNEFLSRGSVLDKCLQPSKN